MKDDDEIPPAGGSPLGIAHCLICGANIIRKRDRRSCRACNKILCPNCESIAGLCPQHHAIWEMVDPQLRKRCELFNRMVARISAAAMASLIVLVVLEWLTYYNPILRDESWLVLVVGCVLMGFIALISLLALLYRSTLNQILALIRQD